MKPISPDGKKGGPEVGFPICPEFPGSNLLQKSMVALTYRFRLLNRIVDIQRSLVAKR